MPAESRDEHAQESRRSTKRIPAGSEQLTVYVPADLANAARNAVIATTPYARGYQGLSALVADALSDKIAQLEKRFNNAKAFPQRKVSLRRGAPLK